MKRSFSFSEKPVLSILQRFPLLLPGIERVVSIYYDKESDRLNVHSIRKDKAEYFLEESNVNDSEELLQKFRKDSASYVWMQIEDIPFEIISKEKVQLSIFNELNNNILLIRLLNDFDNLHDLFFIYFNYNLSNFGIVNSKKTLSTENKTIIGHLLRNALDTYLANFKEDRELFISLNENNQAIIDDLSRSKHELAIMKEKYKDGIIHLCKSYLVDLSRYHGNNFLFSNEAIGKLREFDGDMDKLKIILDKAAHYAQTTHINGNLQNILISDHHLIFNLNPNKKNIQILPESEQTSDIPARYNRTFSFLNKLENAAQTVKSKNLLLTSANVGNEFPSPIKPSAITDALKNHQSKIIYLFKELPHHWLIIRTEFRPVQNILNPKPERQKRTG
jgi:hypothetical protein